jgi:acylphosphatase
MCWCWPGRDQAARHDSPAAAGAAPRDTLMTGRPGDLARLEANVHGRVHGVGFRYFVVVRAMRTGLTGFVSNEQDGSLHVVVEGPRADLEDLLEALHEGPSSALVERVDAEWLPYTGHWGTFSIESRGHRGD